MAEETRKNKSATTKNVVNEENKEYVTETIVGEDIKDNSNTMPNANDIDSSMTAMLYYQMDKLFGMGSQLFTMEYPGRTLNPLDYAYPIEDYNSAALNKPYAVAENEFRLSDNMLDLSPIVQGPNGSKLSNVYNTVLNNYTPKIDDLKDFILDKLELRLFLMEEITDEIDGTEYTCSRLEFCQKLYLRYLSEKYNWDQEKIETQKKYHANKELDEYAKWLATTSWTRDHELEALFNDAIIRGFYHEIMTILGFIDVASPAERLSSAKSNRRSSVRRALDSSMEVLPVQFQPSNWFRSLTPNFSPKDLTLGREYLELQYKSKTQLLSSLESELRMLATRNVGNEEIAELETKVAQLKSAMLEDEKNYFKGYTQAQVSAIKLAFEVASFGNMTTFIKSLALDNALNEFVNTLKVNQYPSLLGVADEKLNTLVEDTYKLYNEHIEYFTSYNELINVSLDFASAQSSDYQDQIEILKERISILSKEVFELATILTSDCCDGNTDNSTNVAANTFLPIPRYNEDTEFTDIIFSTDEFKNISDDEMNSTYGSLKASFGNFFFNSSSKFDYSASNSKFVQKMYSSGFTMGLRVAKVTIDRGGWFDPSIFDITSSYMCLNPKNKGGAGLTPTKVLDAYNSGSVKKNQKYSVVGELTSGSNGDEYVLPAFPQAFLIAKDVVIKANISDFNEADYQEFRKMTASTTTSLFGIRVSGAYGNESYMGHSESSGGTTEFYMRIPGPQILGWFMELPSKDISSPYAGLSKSEYFNEIIDGLKVYKEKLAELNNVSDGIFNKDVRII